MKLNSFGISLEKCTVYFLKIIYYINYSNLDTCMRKLHFGTLTHFTSLLMKNLVLLLFHTCSMHKLKYLKNKFDKP